MTSCLPISYGQLQTRCLVLWSWARARCAGQHSPSPASHCQEGCAPAPLLSPEHPATKHVATSEGSSEPWEQSTWKAGLGTQPGPQDCTPAPGGLQRGPHGVLPVLLTQNNFSKNNFIMYPRVTIIAPCLWAWPDQIKFHSLNWFLI